MYESDDLTSNLNDSYSAPVFKDFNEFSKVKLGADFEELSKIKGIKSISSLKENDGNFEEFSKVKDGMVDKELCCFESNNGVVSFAEKSGGFDELSKMKNVADFDELSKIKSVKCDILEEDRDFDELSKIKYRTIVDEPSKIKGDSGDIYLTQIGKDNDGFDKTKNGCRQATLSSEITTKNLKSLLDKIIWMFTVILCQIIAVLTPIYLVFLGVR